MSDPRADLVGLVLAAGAGRRMGGPKALLRRPSGESFVAHAAWSLYAGGLPRVVVVLGAAAEEAAALVPAEPWAHVVVAPDWAEGMGASLRAGLAALGGTAGMAGMAATEATAVLAAVVTLVDLPDVTGDVVARVVAALGPQPGRALVRAAYDGMAGHPVAIGREHWPAVIASARGDAGARRVFATEPHVLVECGDLATGRDLDAPQG